MALTKTPLTMLDAKGIPGSDVRFDGEKVVLNPEENPNNLGVVGGNFDDANGKLTLSLANGTELVVSGFMTQGNIGVGVAGAQGLSGADGTDGLLGADGFTGFTGCAGPAGAQGAQGPQGPAGPRGFTGPKGPTGPQGDAGQDGIVQIFIQTEDPSGSAMPGALWIKP